MAENKNQISTQEWSERMRSAGRQATTPPASISRASVNTSGPLAQIRQNLTALNNQKYGLALANIKGQYNLADKMASLTQDINANAIARKEQLYANRQANLDRMAQMYGQYYQQFGNVLNKDALDFLDQHSDIKVPTLTAIMAGYEHARASRAEQALAALDRTAKMAEAEAQLAEKQTALENEKAANDQYANLQKLDAQSKANQAVYDAQKAFLDEQARNEMLGAGLASTGRGTGVRALPGFAGGVGAGARAGVGRVPSAVTGARSGETVTGAAAPTGRVVQTADGQTVAVDNNKNVIGTVVPTQNGSVVVNDNGQTVGSVDANGNVIPTQQSLYAQYLAAGGGGYWEDAVENTIGALGNPYNFVSAIGAGQAINAARNFGTSARAGYLDPVRRAGWEGARLLATDANMRTAEASKNFIDAATQDPRYNPRNPGRYENYLQLRQNERIRRLSSGLPLGTYNTTPEELRAWNNLQFLRSAETGSDAANRNLANAVRSLGGQEAIDRASRAGRFMRGAGAVARGAARVGGRFVPGLGWAMLATDAVTLGAPLLWGAAQGVWQGAKNVGSDMFGNRPEQIAAALAAGEPVPPQVSGWQAAREGFGDARRWFGRFGLNFGMANPEDVQNFENFYEQRTGQRLDFDTKVLFDKQNPVTRTVIMDGLLSGEINGIGDVRKFIENTINTYSNPQEQQAIQQQIEQENRDARFERSTGSNGDHSGVKAVTEDIQNRLAKLGYDYTYDDVMDGANAYLDVLGWYETRNKAGAEGVPTKNGTAKSRWQLMDRNFDTGRKRILKKYGDKLSQEDRDLLIKAKDANALDNEYGQPLLAMIVLDNVFEDLAINNEHLDKKGPNIRSDQMFGEIVGMVKMAREDGDVDDQGNTRLDPIILGNIGRLGGVVHMRATDQKNVGDWYTNVNGAINEFPGIGFRRNAQGGNDPWWDLSFTPLTRYGELRGRGAQVQAQRAGYSFDVAPGVDVDNLNTLLVQRFSAANDAMVAATGVKGRTNSGYRTTAKQTELYNNQANNPNPVGKPGWSFHQSGMALDFNNDEWEKAFNASDQLKHDYGTFDDFLGAFGLQRGVTDRNGKRSDLVHLTMVQDDEYHNTIDHDRLMASRGKWGDQGGNYWMRGVGSRPQQTQPAWDVSPQYMVENFGYPTMQYPATDYDPNLIFAGNQNGYVFDYDYDEDGKLISY